MKIKTGYKLELLTPEIMELLGSRKKYVDLDKDSENIQKLESVEVVLVHCSLVKNDYQHTPKVLFSFVPNKQFGQLINISPHSLTMMNTVNTDFSFVEVICKKIGNKYGKKLMDTTKTGIDAAKRVVQKTAEAKDLLGNKIAEKITSIGKPKEIEEIYIPPEKKTTNY